MMNFPLTGALILCSLRWISTSSSQTVEAQLDDEVTLLCTNISKSQCPTFWLRLVNRTKMSCISVMYDSSSSINCDTLQDGKYEMSTNISTIMLKIKNVDLSDSGLYFCGFYSDGRPVFSAIHLLVKGSHNDPRDVSNSQCEEESDETAKLMTVILGVLTVVLVMVITGLVVKYRKLQMAEKDDQNPVENENVSSDELNYAAVTFQPKARRREMEPNVIYASTR